MTITGSDSAIKYEAAGETFVTNRMGGQVAAEKDIVFAWSVDLESELRRLIEWRKHHKRRRITDNKDN